MFADKSNQFVIREAIRKIALERINISLDGMHGIGTARMIPCYSSHALYSPSTFLKCVEQFWGVTKVNLFTEFVIENNNWSSAYA